MKAILTILAVTVGLAGPALPRGPFDDDSSSAKAQWFRAQQNQRHGQCCGDETKDGQALSAEQWRQVEPRWDLPDVKPYGPPDNIDPRQDFYVRWEVLIRGKWEPIHGYQLVIRKTAAGAEHFISGDAEVWYRFGGGYGGAEPIIFCFLPGHLG